MPPETKEMLLNTIATLPIKQLRNLSPQVFSLLNSTSQPQKLNQKLSQNNKIFEKASNKDARWVTIDGNHVFIEK